MSNTYKIIARVISQKGTCEAGLREGDEFEVGEKTPDNVCSFAFTSIFPFATVLQFGGVLPWEKDPDKATIACPDAENPVVFELRKVRQ